MSFDFTLEEHIDAAPAKVFSVATDLDQALQWMNGIVRIAKVGDEPFGVGTQWEETRKMFGKDATEHFEVMEYEPPTKVRLFVDGSKGASNKGGYHFTYVIEPDGTGSKLTLRSTIETSGWLSSLMGRPFVGFFKRAMRKDLRSMKAFIERP